MHATCLTYLMLHLMTLIVFREQYKCLCSSKFICECKGKAGREADHSRPSSAEVEEWVDLYLHSSNTPSWGSAQREHRDYFTLYLLCR